MHAEHIAVNLLGQLPTIVHLQEVSESAFATLSEQLDPDACTFSLGHRQIGGAETFACEWGIDFSQLTREVNDSEDNCGWYYIDADDRLHGPEAFWWDSARTRPRGQGCWYEDEKHGWWTMWWVDGHKTSEGSYTHGATVGIWKRWDILDRACSLCDFGDGSTGMASCRPCQTP